MRRIITVSSKTTTTTTTTKPVRKPVRKHADMCDCAQCENRNYQDTLSEIREIWRSEY